MKKPANPTPKAPQAKSKRVTMELELEFYWKIQDRQRSIERETGMKLSIARICEQQLREALDNAGQPGHNQFDNKSCPSFFVPAWLKKLGIPEHNIEWRDPSGCRKLFR